MKPRPFHMVTLMEILETSAEAWWRLAGLIGQVIVKFEPQYSVPAEGYNILGATLGEIQREASRLELCSTVAQLNRIYSAVDDPKIDNSRMRLMIIDLHQRMCDELHYRFFLSIPPENSALYRSSDPLFGKEVEAKFPEMSEDISEAGKCLALNRATAAVFHLMRIMEIAVQRFGDKLGVALPTEKNWQNVLDEINKAVRALDQKAAQTRAYLEAAAHLYNVKVCWRNAVMHPKQTYTPDEAEAVFGAVRTFIRDLAGML